MKILNLYAGIGGNRKLWGDGHKVTAIEQDQATANVYAEYFPNDNVIVGNAHEYLMNHFKEFDFIWSSPPWPSHSDVRRCGVQKGQCQAIYPDMALYQEIILLQHFAPKKTKWCVENVKPYYTPLIHPTKQLHRHFYWANFRIGEYELTESRKIESVKASDTIYGFNIKNSKIRNKRKALRNMVNPELGKYILNCAMNIIEKQNTSQLDLFT